MGSGSESTDGQCLARHLAGDSAAFAEVVRRHGAMVLSVCRRVLDESGEAEDAAQAAFIALARRAGRLSGESDVGAWLHRVARYAATDALRARRTRAMHESRAAAMRSRESGQPEEKNWEKISPQLDAALDSLPARMRRVLVACYLQGRSQSEAARQLRMPEGTVAVYCRRGIDRLRRLFAGTGGGQLGTAALGSLLLSQAGAGAALSSEFLASVIGVASGKAASAAPAALAKGALNAMFYSQVKSAAAVLCGVLLAGGAAATGATVFGSPAPQVPTLAAAAEEPAPVNEYKGLQEREEVFEFAEKPKVTKQGDPSTSSGQGKWIITFASKGKCDATVSIVDKDGKIIRHLASGVLGANAPYPFQQNSLAQKIEWDGLTTDFKKADPAGCKVKVSLGLQAKYDKSIGYDPAYIPFPKPYGNIPNVGDKVGVLVGAGSDGLVYVATSGLAEDPNCLAFDKDGRYVKTVLPPPAAEMEKNAAAMGMKLSTTKWGDKVLVCDWFGPFRGMNVEAVMPKLVPGVEFKPGAPPANLQPVKATGVGVSAGKIPHLAADRARDEIYAGFGGQTRFIGKTGERDKTWFPDPQNGLGGDPGACEASVGMDGLIYLRVGGSGYGRHMVRLDHDGKPVPFRKENTVRIPDPKKGGWWAHVPAAFKGGVDAVFCGVLGNSSTFQTGLYVAPNGLIVMGIHELDKEWAVQQGLVKPDDKAAKGAMLPNNPYNYRAVFDSEGKIVSANSLGTPHVGNGVTMDRDGNIYSVYGAKLPEGQKTWDASDLPPSARTQGSFGTLVKFRGQGGKFPLNVGEAKVKLGQGGVVPGALWAYGGMSGQSGGDCQCHHNRFDMDFFARSFIPSTQLYSITVLDSNGNRVARFGRYGNVDDGEADLKSGKGDAIRFAWMRAVAVSDAALYVVDPGNRRILRAALSYAAEETVPVP